MIRSHKDCTQMIDGDVAHMNRRLGKMSIRLFTDAADWYS